MQTHRRGFHLARFCRERLESLTCRRSARENLRCATLRANQRIIHRFSPRSGGFTLILCGGAIATVGQNRKTCPTSADSYFQCKQCLGCNVAGLWESSRTSQPMSASRTAAAHGAAATKWLPLGANPPIRAFELYFLVARSTENSRPFCFAQTGTSFPWPILLLSKARQT